MKKLLIVVLFFALIFSGIYSIAKDKSDGSIFAAGLIGATLIKPKNKIIGKQFNNSKGNMAGLGIIDRLFCNSNGAIDPTAAGYQVLIDTLSYIRSEVIEQSFYEIPIADYMPVDIGEAAWGSEIVQNVSILTGGDFYAGDVNANPSKARQAGVSAFVTPNRIPTQQWNKHTEWTTLEIKQAAALNKWDVIAGRISALKENWDLGIQKNAFLGHPYITTMTGLLNNADVTVNTDLITTPISEMTVAELNAFLATLLNTYFANTNKTKMPNTFIMPTSDFLGLGSFVGDTSVVNPLIQKIDVIETMFKKMTGNPNFKVLMLAYADKAINSKVINKNRYCLYNNDPKTMKLAIPIDLNIMEAYTADGFNWSQGGYGQYSGLLVTKPKEVLYIDETAAST
jgi:hypothetical protein